MMQAFQKLIQSQKNEKLIKAMRKADIDAVAKALEQGADPNMSVRLLKQGYSTYRPAMPNGKDAEISLLDFIVSGTRMAYKAIGSTDEVKMGNGGFMAEAAELLVQKGAKIDQMMRDGLPAILSAGAKGYWDLVGVMRRKLADEGKDGNVGDAAMIA